jgi:hypothetical protein
VFPSSVRSTEILKSVSHPSITIKSIRWSQHRVLFNFPDDWKQSHLSERCWFIRKNEDEGELGIMWDASEVGNASSSYRVRLESDYMLPDSG